MSKLFVFNRFDIAQQMGQAIDDVIMPNPDGACMLATDAINREAELLAQIRTLEVDSTNVIAQLRKTIASCDAEIMRLRGAWVRLTDGLPAEPGSCLAMFKPDNDFGITYKYAVQVEFGEFTSSPRDFTMFIDYRNEVVTDQITDWHALPANPDARQDDVSRLFPVVDAQTLEKKV